MLQIFWNTFNELNQQPHIRWEYHRDFLLSKGISWISESNFWKPVFWKCENIIFFSRCQIKWYSVNNWPIDLIWPWRGNSCSIRFPEDIHNTKYIHIRSNHLIFFQAIQDIRDVQNQHKSHRYNYVYVRWWYLIQQLRNKPLRWRFFVCSSKSKSKWSSFTCY